MQPLDLRGVTVACVTPFDERYAIDEGALAAFVDYLVGAGAIGIAVNTDAGEGATFSPEERRRVLQTAVRAASGRVPVIAGVGGRWTRDTVDQVKEARDLGAAAVMVFPLPAFRGAVGADPVVIGHHEAVAEVGVPMILFQLTPELGGAPYPEEALRRIAALDPVIAIKDASFDAVTFRRTAQLMHRLPRPIQVLTGNDTFIYESYLLGADGALIGLGSIATAAQVALFDLARRGAHGQARALWEALLPLVEATYGTPPLQSHRGRIKEGLVQQGLFPSHRVRPPLVPPGPEEARRVAEALAHLAQYEGQLGARSR